MEGNIKAKEAGFTMESGRIEPKNFSLLKLFWTTFKIGAFTFGGGYAMIPLIASAFSEENEWLNKDEMLDILAVSQSLPGAIAINSSIMAGYRLSGIKGSVVAVLGSALPSLVVLSVIGMAYQSFKDNKYVAAALYGVRASVVALMVSAVIKLGKPALKEWKNWAVLALCLALYYLTPIHPVLIIILGGVIGFIAKGRGGKNGG